MGECLVTWDGMRMISVRGNSWILTSECIWSSGRFRNMSNLRKDLDHDRTDTILIWEGQKLAGLYEANPVTDQGRIMWLKCLIELQVSQTFQWNIEQWGWKNFWELTEKAIVEWPEVAGRAIPEAYVAC